MEYMPNFMGYPHPHPSNIMNYGMGVQPGLPGDYLDGPPHFGALKEINHNEGPYDMSYQPNFFGVANAHMVPEKEIPMIKDTPNQGRKLRTQHCAVPDCPEVSYKSRISKNWMCRQHQLQTQKEKLKKKLEERCRTPIVDLQPKQDIMRVQAPSGIGGGGHDNNHATTFLKTLRPSLLEEVLNDKKLGLMRSPEVVQFLKREQKKILEQKKDRLQIEKLAGEPLLNIKQEPSDLPQSGFL